MTSFFRRSFQLFALIFVGFLAVLYTLQDRMIFPGTATQGAPEARVTPPPGAELVHLKTSTGDRIVALYGAALEPDGRPLADPGRRPAFVYFYGNAMCLAYCGLEFQRFRRLGLNVLIPDYSGYGLSGGRASEAGCRESALAAYGYLKGRGFPSSRILVGGWSLGGAVAVDLASREEVAGLVAFSTFTSTRDMGTTIFPLPLPNWFYAHPFDSLAKIATLSCPILLGHGRLDTLVPFAMFRRMAAAAPEGRTTTIVVERAGHNDFYDVAGRQLDEAIAAFVARAVPDP